MRGARCQQPFKIEIHLFQLIVTVAHCFCRTFTLIAMNTKRLMSHIFIWRREKKTRTNKIDGEIVVRKVSAIEIIEWLENR